MERKISRYNISPLLAFFLFFSCSKGDSDFYKERANKLLRISIIREKLAATHNKIALKLIDGKTRSLPVYISEDFKKERTKECSLLKLEKKSCNTYFKKWQEYLEVAQKINKSYVNIDPTLDSYLGDVKEEISLIIERIKCKKRYFSIKKTYAFKTIENVAGSTSQKDETEILNKVKKVVYDIAAAEKNGKTSLKSFELIVDTVKDQRKTLTDLFELNEKMILIFKNRLSKLKSDINGIIIGGEEQIVNKLRS